MRWPLLAVLILTAASLFAQPDQRSAITVYDSFPVPAKFHVAARTVYATFPLESGRPLNAQDTTIQKYDRNGNCTESMEFREAKHLTSGWSRTTHYFSYDQLNRLVSDSEIFVPRTSDGDHTFTKKITYNTKNRLFVERYNLYGDSSFCFNYYNENNVIIARYSLEADGDTSWFSKTSGDTNITVYYSNDDERGRYISTSDTTITTSKRITESDGFYRNVSYYNKHQLTDRVSYSGYDNVNDTTHYTYNRKRQLIEVTSTFIGLMCFDPEHITSHTEYVYNKDGLLIQEKYWEEHESDNVYFTYYTYNQVGLLTGIRSTVQRGSNPEVKVKELVVEYTYW